MAVGQKINVVDEYENVIKKVHSYGIAIRGFFIFGFDEDDEDTFQRTVRFVQKMRLESAQFDLLIPYPGTSLYESLDKAGRIVTRDWSKYGHSSMFEPKSMSPAMLQNGRAWAWCEFYSLASIWRRLGVARRNLVTFWAVNLFCYYRVHWLRTLA